MGQKVHPVGFRLGISTCYMSQWFAKPSRYAECVAQDALIRDMFTRHLSDRVNPDRDCGVTAIHIDRRHAMGPIRLQKEVLFIHLSVMHPERLKQTDDHNRLYPILKSLCTRLPFEISFALSKTPSSAAVHIAESMVDNLQRRKPFRRVMREALKTAHPADMIGVKVAISGRLNGAEIARTEWVRKGRVPLHSLSLPVEYCSASAHTPAGILGIKVWVAPRARNLTPLVHFSRLPSESSDTTGVKADSTTDHSMDAERVLEVLRARWNDVSSNA